MRALLLVSSIGFLATPALAEQVTAPTTDQATIAPGDEQATRNGDEILVIATRLRDQVEAPQAAVVTLNEADIASYGAASISDLITAISPQTGTGRGRGGGFPVLLINGQRVSSFREMRNIPPEAIKRMEVLPEEVALRYGYPPNQRVINLILRDNFAQKALEVSFGAPTRGGSGVTGFEAQLLKINGASRINLAGETKHTTLLTEAERGVIQTAATAPTVATDPSQGLFRSLIADSTQSTLNLNWSAGLSKQPGSGSLSLNGALTRNDTRSLSGLDAVLLTNPTGATVLRTLDGPLTRLSRTVTAQAGATLNKPLGSWQLTATADASHAETDSRIDRRRDTSALVAAARAGTLAIAGALPVTAGGGSDQALITNDSLITLVTAVGRPARLPAGEVATTFKAGMAYNGIVASDTRSAAGTTRLRRGDLSAGINVALPLTSRKEGVLSGVGDITLNFSGGVNRLSDFGTLIDYSAGATWALTEKLNFQASYIVNEAAPALTDLGNPQTVTFNVPVFDFTRSQSALVTVISGGNPLLVRETQRDIKFGINWTLPFLSNSNFIAEYFRNHSSNVTNAFPLLTPAIEAAFPGRAVRDASTRLISIDSRPITLADTSGSRLRYGLNVSGTIGKPSPGGRGGFGGPPGGGMMGRGGQGRWNLSIYHTVRFAEQVLVAPGGAVLNLLNGDALNGGGVARHALEFEGGGFYKGFGLRLNGAWNAPTHVRLSGLPGTSDLRFGSVTTLNFRLFADLGQQKSLTKLSSFFKGSRLSLRIDNLLDSRQRVTDAGGVVPISYQPDLIDPRGRVVGVEFRKTL